MTSTYLTARQLAGLMRAGEILAPGDADLPSFSRLGCIEHVDRILEYMGDKDLADFGSLMGVFAWLPGPVLRSILWLMTKNQSMPGSLGFNLRMLELGVKGVVMTLYYSGLSGAGFQGKSVYDIIGWDAKICTRTE
ncbi:MAG: hypothetical protein AB1714_26465 [Acidobacteriota bacterium]